MVPSGHMLSILCGCSLLVERMRQVCGLRPWAYGMLVIADVCSPSSQLFLEDSSDDFGTSLDSTLHLAAKAYIEFALKGSYKGTFPAIKQMIWKKAFIIASTFSISQVALHQTNI